MLKISYIISFILFMVSCFLPFKGGIVEYKNPKVLTTNNSTLLDKFIQTAKAEEYTNSSPIEFTYAPNYNKDAPVINAASAIVIDINNKEIIYAKNEKEQKPVASLSKVMTAILAAEHLDINERVLISKHAASIGENTMNLRSNEEFSIKELLYGLILHSANDAAVALAEASAGTEEEFKNWMNRKAELLGAKSTLFADSSGLNMNRKPFYSTALDMAKIAVYSQENHKELKEIYNTFQKTIEGSNTRQTKALENQTNLLTTYPGVKGMKTGYTSEAGLCLITYAENEGKELLIVILDSTDRRGDSILLLDYGYNKSGVNIEHNLL